MSTPSSPGPWSPFTAEHRLDDGDRPTIVFMSALFAGGWIWDHPYRRLESAGWPVLRTNEPICALDSKVVGSIERLGDVLLDVCDAVGVKDVIICANSSAAWWRSTWRAASPSGCAASW